MMVPKELELEKESDFELRLQLPDARGAMKEFLKSREVVEFLSGALAGAMTKAILAPLETIRQSSVFGFDLLSALYVMGIFLEGSEQLCHVWQYNFPLAFITVILCIHSVIGLMQSSSYLMRTRMVVGVGSKHIAGSFFEIVDKQGWQGLWAGNTINMLRIVPTQAIELGTFECVNRTVSEVQERWKENGPHKLQIGHVSLDLSFSWISPIAVGGAAAGIVSTLVCHPLEVLKDRLTVNREAYPTISLAVQKIHRDCGIGGFYAGISPTLIGMLPYSTCYYFMYETMKKSYCQTKKKKSLSRADMLLIGALSGFTASTISFPLEVARKRLMVGSLQGKCPTHMVAALSEVIQEEGLKGLFRGWGASCLKVMPSSGITWMFYEAWKDILLAERLRL